MILNISKKIKQALESELSGTGGKVYVKQYDFDDQLAIMINCGGSKYIHNFLFWHEYSEEELINTSIEFARKVSNKQRRTKRIL